LVKIGGKDYEIRLDVRILLVALLVTAIGTSLTYYYVVYDPHHIQLNANFVSRGISLLEPFDDLYVESGNFQIMTNILGSINYRLNITQTYDFVFSNVTVLVPPRNYAYPHSIGHTLFQSHFASRVLIENPESIVVTADKPLVTELERGSAIFYVGEGSIYGTLIIENITNSYITIPEGTTLINLRVTGGSLTIYSGNEPIFYRDNYQNQTNVAMAVITIQPDTIAPIGRFNYATTKYESMDLICWSSPMNLKFGFCEGNLNCKNTMISVTESVNYKLLGSNDIMLESFNGEIIMKDEDCNQVVDLRGYVENVYLDNENITHPSFKKDLLWFIGSPMAFFSIIISSTALLLTHRRNRAGK